MLLAGCLHGRERPALAPLRHLTLAPPTNIRSPITYKKSKRSNPHGATLPPACAPKATPTAAGARPQPQHSRGAGSPCRGRRPRRQCRTPGPLLFAGWRQRTCGPAGSSGQEGSRGKRPLDGGRIWLARAAGSGACSRLSRERCGRWKLEVALCRTGALRRMVQPALVTDGRLCPNSSRNRKAATGEHSFRSKMTAITQQQPGCRISAQSGPCRGRRPPGGAGWRRLHRANRRAGGGREEAATLLAARGALRAARRAVRRREVEAREAASWCCCRN